jgi:RNA polymerase sigma factor (TIGR02999 family)
MSEVTRVLSAIERGDPHAAAQLLPLVYSELRQLAAHKLARQPAGQTLQATALVHEAYLRLVGPAKKPSAAGVQWDNRRHFFGAAAEAMRRILLDRARDKRRVKRGGGNWRRLSLDCIDLPVGETPEGLLAVDKALQQLAKEDPQGAELVKLRFFAGLTLEEAAATLGITRRTADRWWAYARSWLYLRLQQDEDTEEI